MPYSLQASWTTDCVPQEPVTGTQRPGETEEEFEARFEAAVATAKQEHPPDPPGACP